jgi:hypothetical protein
MFRIHSGLGADPDLDPSLDTCPGFAITLEIKISHFLSNLGTGMFLLPVQVISYRT